VIFIPDNIGKYQSDVMGKVVENLRCNISFSFVGGVFMDNIIIVAQDEEKK
jgi:hypothetical protein